MRYFFGHGRGHRGAIFLSHPQKNHQPFADFACDLVVDPDFRTADPLRHDSQPSSSFPPTSFFSAANPTTPPRYMRTPPALVRLASNRPSAPGPARRPANDGSWHNPPYPARTRTPAPRTRRTERDRILLHCVELVP